MAQALQYTLEQVAQQLDLSESIVTRLSQYFGIPKSYYRAKPGEPRLLFFQPAEMAMLSQIQKRLLAGKSLQDVREELRTATESLPYAPVASQSVVEEKENDGQDLVAYEQNERLKAHLAEETLKQYRHGKQTAKPPFRALAKMLQEERVANPLPDSEKKRTDKVLPKRPAVGSKKYASPASSPRVSRDTWLTTELAERVFQMQHALLAKSR